MTVAAVTAPRRRPRRRLVTAVAVWAAAVPCAAVAAVRLLAADRGPLVQLLAFTPYALAAALVVAVAAVAVRRWAAAVLAVAAAVALGTAVLPRAVADTDRGPDRGVPLTVLTANLLAGAADAGTLVRLVRDGGVAVLALQEFTPGARDRLGAAGLDALLPYRVDGAEVGVFGSGLYSRYPVTAPTVRRLPSGTAQAAAVVRVPGAGPVLVESAHPRAPHSVGAVGVWRADLAAQSAPDPAGPPTVLLGDFNATLDHGPLRAVIARGYRNAADAVGVGLLGTWGPYGGGVVPPVTIDHVLADRRLGVDRVRVHDLPGSDHRPVSATLLLPG